MIEPITIPKELQADSPLNYDFLRAEGIKHIQQLAGHVWSDHNTHDPGITMLEQLCYAITDLAYRADHDIQDLLGQEGSSSFENLYSPATILTVNPVTLLDFRKVVIDVPGVKNAWVERVGKAPNAGEEELNLKGLFRVVFEKDESAGLSSGLRQKVRDRLQACRGVCEDFEEIVLLDNQLIALHGTVEVGQVEDINRFVAEVLIRISNHISPRVPFYTLQELLEQGKKVDEIFDGPALQHGFIDDEDLKKTKRKEALHSSDLIRAIMDQNEVLAVNGMALSTGSGTRKNWALSLDMSKTPRLDVRSTLESLEFARQGLKANVNPERVQQWFLTLRDAQQFEELPLEKRDIVLLETEDRGLENYFSLQNHLPSNYGIGELGLSGSADPARKAQAKQLKSYLIFFEQLLANYFSQVAHFKDLMGFDGEDRRSYFRQSLLQAVPGMEEVIQSEEGYNQFLEEMSADTEHGLERKNMFLNHLLARFSEAFTDYGMLLHLPGTTDEHAAAQQLIQDKANFLKDYPALSGGRAKGYQQTLDSWGNDNISGLEMRIARKLGIEDWTRKELGDQDAEGFHMVEHLLLRPGADSGEENPSPLEQAKSELRDLLLTSPIVSFSESNTQDQTICESPQHGLQNGESIRIAGTTNYNGSYQVVEVTEDTFEIEVVFVENEALGRWGEEDRKGDPFSLQLSFVFPDWAARYQNENFKSFVENMVREESPAHLGLHIQWLTKPEMQRFDQVYRDFLAQLVQQ